MPNLEEVFKLVLDSPYREAWSSIDLSSGTPASLIVWDEARGGGWSRRTPNYYMVHREQIELGLAWGHDIFTREDAKLHNRPEWAENASLPDPGLHPINADILWNGTLIYRTAMFVVDGGRAYVPDASPQFVEDPDSSVPQIEGWHIDAAHLGFAEVLHELSGGSGRLSVRDYCSRYQFETVGDPARLPLDVAF